MIASLRVLTMVAILGRPISRTPPTDPRDRIGCVGIICSARAHLNLHQRKYLCVRLSHAEMLARDIFPLKSHVAFLQLYYFMMNSSAELLHTLFL